MRQLVEPLSNAVRRWPPRPTDHCNCSAFNQHLLDLLDWTPDPACPRHGLEAQLARADQTLDIDTSHEREEAE